MSGNYRRPERLASKIRKLTKVKWIDPMFPTFARSSLKTTGAKQRHFVTLTDGFLLMATLKGSNLNDPFGDLDLIKLDGTVETDSTMESAGHDVFDKIYNAYRVLGSTLVFKIRQMQIDTDHVVVATNTSATATQTYKVPLAIQLVIIPTTDVTLQPAKNWHEIIHHPFAYRVRVPIAGLSKSGSWTKLVVRIPNHESFLNTTFRHTATDQGQARRMITFSSGAGAGQSCDYKIFIIGDDALSDITQLCPISYEATMYQHVLFSKVGVDDSSTAIQMGVDYAPTNT